MRSSSVVVCLLAASALAACDPTSPPDAGSIQTSKIFDMLKADEVHLNADWKSGDAAKVAAHFGAKAKVMIPGVAVIDGLPAIQAAVQQDLDTPGFGLTFASDKILIAKSGDLAVARGVYTQTSTDAATQAADTQTGTYVTVYRPEPDGKWKAQWDILTPGPAPAATPAPAAP